MAFVEYSKTVLLNSTEAWCVLSDHNEIVACNFLFRFSSRFAHHCAECEFDVCHDCFKSHSTPLHAHQLYKAKPQGGPCSLLSDSWNCDNCGSIQSSVADNKPWHCPTCKYNLCHTCMRATHEGIINKNRQNKIIFPVYIVNLCVPQIFFCNEADDTRTTLDKCAIDILSSDFAFI